MGLGRGLNALLGDPDLQPQSEGAMTLPISQVEPGINQPRKRFDPESLADLTESIRTYGVIQPITVRRLSTGYYQIVAGERRWRAAKASGLTEVPVTVIEADDRRVLELGLIENLQREDLNPAEEARGYQALMELYNLTQEQVSERIGKSRSVIANSLRLLALDPGVLTLLEEEQLSASQGRALLALTDPELQLQAARKAAEEQLSVRQTEALVKLLLRQQQQSEPQPESESDSSLRLHLGELARNLSGSLGRKVRIQDRGKKGRVELEYYGPEDLETLLSLLDAIGKEGPANG